MQTLCILCNLINLSNLYHMNDLGAFVPVMVLFLIILSKLKFLCENQTFMYLFNMFSRIQKDELFNKYQQFRHFNTLKSNQSFSKIRKPSLSRWSLGSDFISKCIQPLIHNYVPVFSYNGIIGSVLV